MPQKRAKYITHDCDEQCVEIRKFIEDAGVLLDFRDLGKKPMSADEIDKLVGHINITHFLNPMSKSYEKHGLDKELPERDIMLGLIAEDNTLLKHPIIKTIRLITIGGDKAKISEMLQLNGNGSGNMSDRNANGSSSSRGGKNRSSRSSSPSR